MGGTCSREKPLRFIIQGLDAAGKTSLLYRLKLGEVVTTIPTIGFNVETLHSSGMEITAWDLGGRDKMRALHRHYYAGTEGFIYVIDAADVERVDDSLYELTHFLLQEEIQGVIMVLANKQDLENALSPEQIEDRIRVKCKFSNDVSLFVVPCSVVTGEGVHESFQHLVDHVKFKREGKLQPGIIPSFCFPTNQEQGNMEDCDVKTEKGNAFHRIKNSLFKDPFSMLKSLIFY